MPRAGNIAKTMTSNGKQFTVTREMLTAIVRDGWNLSGVFKFCFCFVLLYNKSLNDCSPRDQSLSVNYKYYPSKGVKEPANYSSRTGDEENVPLKLYNILYT